MYDVSKEPDIRREVSQLQRCVTSGSLETGMLKLCVAEPHEHETIRLREALILLTQPNQMGLFDRKIQILGYCSFHSCIASIQEVD